MRSSKPFIKNRNKLGASKPIFVPNLVSGNSLKDVISQTGAVVSISGARWGIVNGVVAQFAANVPPVEDKCLRGCPAFTQYFLNNQAPVTQSITLIAGSYCLWIEGTGSATFNGLTATVGNPKVFTLGSGFTGNCTITGDVTKVMLNSGLFPAPFTPTAGTTVSVVSEAATATTGTSFDLDLPALSAFKDGLRGRAIGANLWGTPTFSTPPWTDNSTHYVCDGTVTYSAVNKACVQTGKFYEIEFTTGSVTTNGLVVYIGAQIVFNGTLSANTKYVLRNSSATTGANVAFSSGAGFVGQISKNIIVREIQAQGHIELEVESNVDSGWLANSTHHNILSARDYEFSLLYISKEVDSSISFKTYDGANLAAIINQVLTVGKILKISLDYGTYTDGTQKMCLTVNGTKSSVVAFSGSFGTQDLRFFFNNTVHMGWIKNVKYYEKPRW